MIGQSIGKIWKKIYQAGFFQGTDLKYFVTLDNVESNK